MTIRLLVANGCSFTWGDELAERDHAWPHVLGRQLGVDVVNLGICGGSNRRMVRTTVAALPGIAAERGLPAASVLYLVMWASVERFEFFDPDDTDAGGRSPWLPGDERWHRVLPWAARRRDRISRMFYRHMYSDQGAIETFLADWVLAQSFLELSGFRYGFLAARPLLRGFDPPQRLLRLLDPAHVLGGAAGMDQYAMQEVTMGRHEYGPRGHPLTAAHLEYTRTVITPWVTGLPGMTAGGTAA